MYDRTLRKVAIAGTARKLDGLGKTGMMKVMYFLQQVYKVPLDYEFTLYTYGPYDGDVLTYIDIAEDDNLIEIKPLSSYGYHIHAKNETDIPAELATAIDDIANKFNRYKSRDWELAATIIYVYTAYKRNKSNINKIVLCKRVHSLKPHFNTNEIGAEYSKLAKMGLLKRAVNA